MKFTLEIQSNDQSCIDDPDIELHRAFDALARMAWTGAAAAHGPINDLSGNRIGRYTFWAGETTLTQEEVTT